MVNPQVQVPQHHPKVRMFQWEPESYTIGQPIHQGQSACNGHYKKDEIDFLSSKTLNARTAGI